MQNYLNFKPQDTVNDFVNCLLHMMSKAITLMISSRISLKICFCVYLLTQIVTVDAQDDFSVRDSKHKFGFVTGFGGQSLSHFIDDASSKNAHIYNNFFDQIGINPEGKLWNLSYTYQTYFFQLQYYRTLFKREKWSYEILAQPQINWMKFRFEDDSMYKTKGIEFGINIGFLARRNFKTDKISLYASLSLGPHYITEAPLRQSQGFIFSDNLFVGAHIKINDHLFLDIRPGFRHISNAGLLPLNGGVNSLIMGAGFLILFE